MGPTIQSRLYSRQQLRCHPPQIVPIQCATKPHVTHFGSKRHSNCVTLGSSPDPRQKWSEGEGSQMRARQHAKPVQTQCRPSANPVPTGLALAVDRLWSGFG
jgi:hypothetical protein